MTPSNRRSSEEAKQAPDPAHEEKPDSPGQLKASSWKYIARKTIGEFVKDQCTDLAAALTYRAVLALFPALIALLSLVGLVGQSKETVDTIMQILHDAGAGSVASTLEPILTTLADFPGAGLALTLGLATALWTASGYVNSFSRAMNRIYEIEEGRPIWKLRPVMMLITLVAVILAAIVLLALILTGPAASAVGNAIGLGSSVVTVWDYAKWPVLLVMVVLIVAILYWTTPNVQQPKFRWITIGSVVAILVWLVASAAFGFYVANFSSYNKTYGSLAGVIVFLLWLWITNLALLFGAELDAEIERGRELQAGIKAEDSIQLPARDTTKIEKNEEKRQEDSDKGRALRQSRGETQESDNNTDRGINLMRPEEKTSTSAKILYRPLGLVTSILAGIVAGQVFKQVWKHGTAGPEADAPDALQSEYPLWEIVAAAAGQGATYAVVKSLADRGGARLFQKATGEWPGN